MHVEWASRQSLDMTSINLIEIIANVCLPNLCTCLQGLSGIIAERDAKESASYAVLAGVNGHKENLRQSVALGALTCLRFYF